MISLNLPYIRWKHTEGGITKLLFGHKDGKLYVKTKRAWWRRNLWCDLHRTWFVASDGRKTSKHATLLACLFVCLLFRSVFSCSLSSFLLSFLCFHQPFLTPSHIYWYIFVGNLHLIFLLFLQHYLLYIFIYLLFSFLLYSFFIISFHPFSCLCLLLFLIYSILFSVILLVSSFCIFICLLILNLTLSSLPTFSFCSYNISVYTPLFLCISPTLHLFPVCFPLFYVSLIILSFSCLFVRSFLSFCFLIVFFLLILSSLVS